MFFSKTATLLLALTTGLVTEAAPHHKAHNSNLVARHPEAVPALPAPEVFPPLKRDRNSNNNNNNYDVVEITKVDITEVQQGDSTAVVEQVQQVLIQNSNNNDRKNRKRKSAYRRRNSDLSTVLLVVQQVVVQVVDNSGNSFQELIFAESAITANRGRGSTQTIMISDASTLIAEAPSTQGVPEATGIASASAALVTDPAAVAGNSTQSVTLADVAPTWTSVDPDPLATAIALLQSLEGVQK
ncbi:hypothetical protein AOQ84DRAFT_136900 [Glonium stellatum]|uniref:Uncharacterized protein n=1 Tax=Glonium stellatum TaxID=574774 RepID=A0A8E2F9C3_9PEZI|nr:hypothetical protein AOQ84DRAFT_136900 [Glonium stellatum]